MLQVVLRGLLVAPKLRNSSVVLKCRLEDLLKTREGEQAQPQPFYKFNARREVQGASKLSTGGPPASKLRTVAILPQAQLPVRLHGTLRGTVLDDVSNA